MTLGFWNRAGFPPDKALLFRIRTPAVGVTPPCNAHATRHAENNPCLDNVASCRPPALSRRSIQGAERASEAADAWAAVLDRMEGARDLERGPVPPLQVYMRLGSLYSTLGRTEEAKVTSQDAHWWDYLTPSFPPPPPVGSWCVTAVTSPDRHGASTGDPVRNRGLRRRRARRRRKSRSPGEDYIRAARLL